MWQSHLQPPTHVDIPHVKPTRTQLKTFSQYFGQKSLKIQISHVLSFLSICGSNNININTWAMLPEEHVGSLIKQRPRKHQLELVEHTLGQKLSKAERASTFSISQDLWENECFCFLKRVSSFPRLSISPLAGKKVECLSSWIRDCHKAETDWGQFRERGN